MDRKLRRLSTGTEMSQDWVNFFGANLTLKIFQHNNSNVRLVPCDPRMEYFQVSEKLASEVISL